MTPSREKKTELKAFSASIALLLITLLAVGGCMFDDDGPVEEAEDAVEESVDETGDALEEAADETEDAFDDVEDEIDG